MVRSKCMYCVQEDDVYVYWPEKVGQEVMLGKLALTLKEEKTIKGYTERKIHVRDIKVRVSLSMPCTHYVS